MSSDLLGYKYDRNGFENFNNGPTGKNKHDWMKAKARYYSKYLPHLLHFLFSPCAPEYMPMEVHCNDFFNMREDLDCYREIKKLYPEAVRKAQEFTLENIHIQYYKRHDPWDVPLIVAYNITQQEINNLVSNTTYKPTIKFITV